MWMVPVNLLCRTHLLGEHNEIHKHRHNFEKHHKITGRIFPVTLIEPLQMKARHDALALEMTHRGYNHDSSYEQPDLEYLPEWQRCAKVNIHKSLIDLACRCTACYERIV
jgi:hypothetical protein